MQQKTSEFRKNFSEGLKYARIRRNLTQAALAEELGEGDTTITNWEAGTNGPHRAKLGKIAAFFGVEIDPFTGRWEPAGSVDKRVDYAHNAPPPAFMEAPERDFGHEAEEALRFVLWNGNLTELERIAGLAAMEKHYRVARVLAGLLEEREGNHELSDSDRDGLWMPTLVVAEPVYETGKVVGYRGINRPAEVIVPLWPSTP